MNPFAEWLHTALTTGESVQREAPDLTTAQRPEVARLLEPHFNALIAELAGPPLSFQAELAVQTALVLAEACWLLATANADPPQHRLPAPQTAADHATADVCLASLPVVYRRAAAQGRDNPLSQHLEAILRQWPLSGVLAGLSQPPTSSLEFFDHAGLQLLYAERLVEQPNPSWVPTEGRCREQIERVFDQLQVPVPVMPERLAEKVA